MAGTRLPSAQRRRQIAETALRIIATRGVSALTLALLSEEIGIADASILRHLPNKEAIVDAAISLFSESMAEDLQQDQENPMERLRAFFVQRLKRVRSQPELLGLAFNTRLEDAAGKEGARRVRETVARSARFVRSCLTEAQQRDMVDPNTPPELLVWTVVGILRGAAMGLPSQAGSRQGLGLKSPETVFGHVEKLLHTAKSPRPT